MTCAPCDHAAEHGWWGTPNLTHCRGCHRSWSMSTNQAHCTVCHRHFSGPSHFDRHWGRSGEHRDPQRKGRIYAQRPDGTWYVPDPRVWGLPPSAQSKGAA